VVGLEWYPCCRLKHNCAWLDVLVFRCGWVGVVSVLQAEAQLCLVGCVGVSVWLGWSGIRVAG